MNTTRVIPSPHRRWGNRIIVVLFTMIFAPLGLTLLYVFYDPNGDNPFFPNCYFKQWTTLNCPGCGATRCLYSLLHLDLAQALAYNSLFVIALPFLIYGVAGMMYTLWTGNRAPGRMPGWASKGVVFVILAYWLLRNIDVYPLNMLAPHVLILPG